MTLIDDINFKLIETRYPKIGKSLILLCGYAEFVVYTNNLLNDTNNGQRVGFSNDIVTALLALQAQHDREFPEFVNDPGDVWSMSHF